MTKLQFATNRPLTLRLHAIEGKEHESQFGGAQHLFSADEGVFYVSEAAGKLITDQCRKLGVQPGDAVEICKSETDLGRGRKGIVWIVSVPADDAPAPAQPVVAAPAVAPSRVQTLPVASAAAQDAPELPRWADVLTRNTCVLVDAYAAIVRHASEHHGATVRPDDCRALLTTMFIQYAQKGGLSNAA